MRFRIILLACVLTTLGVGILLLREQALDQAGEAWRSLEEPASEQVFEPAALADLPAPAQRYLQRAITPGTPLARSVSLKVSGMLRSQQGGPLVPFRAEEVLALPRGRVWRARVGEGARPTLAFDLLGPGQARSRRWTWGAIPSRDLSGRDLARALSGLAASEVVWMPSALLPESGATWTAVDDATARVAFSVSADTHEVLLTVDREGRLQRLELKCWNPNANSGEGGEVPLVLDEFAGEKSFGGYLLPAAFRAQWILGELSTFDFYYPELEDAVFPAPSLPAARPVEPKPQVPAAQEMPPDMEYVPPPE